MSKKTATAAKQPAAKKTTSATQEKAMSASARAVTDLKNRITHLETVAECQADLLRAQISTMPDAPRQKAMKVIEAVGGVAGWPETSTGARAVGGS